MVFKRKFFLDLSGGEAEISAAVVAPVRQEAPAKPAEKANKEPSKPTVAAKAAPATSATAVSSAATSSGAAGAEPAGASSLTTAEAIAAELAAAQANRPAPSKATFAPECVTAGGALSPRRRRGGANLAGFKAMAQGMMKN
ncbi:MAG: hypothetical protein VKM01_07355 [Cyanobacteriota bacterium]|nr:hypothetical protein [Cyanobacteriota bacterium]